MKNKLYAIGTAAVVGALVASQAQAVPAFARKYDTACSACHTTWPQLNEAGRKFKLAGYTFDVAKGNKEVSDYLYFDKYFPMSALVASRPYDKRDNGDDQNRAIHEIELITAGNMGKDVSVFFELEAEDEDVNARGFEVGIPTAVMSYNYNQALNAQVAWGPMLFADPYDTYADMRRLTRGHNVVMDQAFGGADGGGKLRHSRQSLSFYGKPVDKLYYNIGYSAVAEDKEGTNPGTVFGRLALDVLPGVMVGALAVDGTYENSITYAGDTMTVTKDADYTRYGIDTQIDVANLRFMAAYVAAEDDVLQSSGQVKSEDNVSWYGSAQYIVTSNGRPTFTPLIQYGVYEKADGNQEYKELTVNLGYYFTENIRGYIEYWDQLDVPNGKDEDSRLTLQINAAF